MLPTLFRSTLPAYALATILLFSGCAKTVTPIHPGAVNQFDSQTYDALITIQAGIAQAKVDVAERFPNQKAALNSVIDLYNVALRSYKTYHQLASSGQLPDASELIRQVQGLQSAFAGILTQIRPITENYARPSPAVVASLGPAGFLVHFEDDGGIRPGPAWRTAR